MDEKRLWASPNLNGRALDRAILLDRECGFPLPMIHKMCDEFTKDAETILTVLEGEVERFKIMNCWSAEVAGKVLARQIAQEAGWIPPQKLQPQKGETLEDLERMSEKEFDEWIGQLRATGARVSRSRSASPSR